MERRASSNRAYAEAVVWETAETNRVLPKHRNACAWGSIWIHICSHEFYLRSVEAPLIVLLRDLAGAVLLGGDAMLTFLTSFFFLINSSILDRRASNSEYCDAIASYFFAELNFSSIF